MDLRAGAAATAWSAACGASIGIGRRAGRHRLALGQRDLVGRDAAGRGDAVEHAVARARARPRPSGRAGAASGDCGSATSSAASRERQPARLLAEIGERGGADAFEIAAIGRERQIEREHLVLAQAAARARSRARSGAAWRRACARRAARAAAPPAWSGSSRRRRCGRWSSHCKAARASASGSTPAMRAEALVLVGEQHLEKARIDVVERRRQPPAAVRRRVGAQQPAVAIDHLRRDAQDRWPSGGGPSDMHPPRAGERRG